jgi:hypothetical protein
MTEPIDAVFTWVDGSDPAWRAKKERVLAAEPDYVQSKDSNAQKRFVDCNELYYSINLLRRNVPWLRTIHLVTDNQCPAWLDKAEMDRLGVQLVDHTEIFAGYEQALPTFNSRSIETMLGNIPGLAEKFIYCNDDCFIVRPIEPTEFFHEGTLVIRGRWGIKNQFWDKVLRRLTRPWFLRGYVCRRPGTELLPGRLRYIDMAHTPHALFRSDFNRVFEDARIRANVNYNVRSAEQLSPVGFVANHARQFRKIIRQDHDWRCLYSDKLREIGPLDEFIAERPWLKFLCLNDLSELDETELDSIHRSLDMLLSSEESVESVSGNAGVVL